MLAKQKFLRFTYPVLRFISGVLNIQNRLFKGNTAPVASFYQLQAETSTGEPFAFEKLHGKKILIVNTATQCGYTAQLGRLTELKNRLPHIEILAFPSNDFKNQEPGDDAAVATFCSIHYGINFPLFKKSTVLKGDHQHPVFRWLSNASLNGWNDRAPVWNFCKYVIDESGRLTHFAEQGVDPLDERLMHALTLITADTFDGSR